MSKPSDSEFSIEDIVRANITLECGGGGGLLFPQDIEFKAPSPNSLSAGRLILATAKTGSIDVKVEMKAHKVFLKIVGRTNDRELLIRVPIGVRIFSVRAVDGSFLYYETMEGYNVVPIYIPNGTDSDQKMQELVLAVTPVPPRDPTQATERLTLPVLTLNELNVRRLQDGLPPLGK